MAYKIVSPRVGTPGDTYHPKPGVNVQALVDHGFIVETKTTAPKGGKVTSKKESEHGH